MGMGTYAVVAERCEALTEAALRVEVREDEEEAYGEDEARDDGPLDDVSRLRNRQLWNRGRVVGSGTHAGVPPRPGDAVVVADPAVGEVVRVDVALAGGEHHCVSAAAAVLLGAKDAFRGRCYGGC